MKEVDLLSALITSLEYLWTNTLWVVLIFLTFMSLGFLIYLHFFNAASFRVVIISQIALIVLTLIFTNFSIIMILVSISVLAATLWMRKTFEPKKKLFSTGYSVITSNIGMLSIFLTAGILITMLINVKNYEEEVMKTNMDLIKNLMPDISEMKDVQKNQIEQITEGFKYAINERYDYLPDETKTQCSILYNGLTESLDSYKQQSFQRIDKQDMVITEEEILQIFPFFGVIIKSTPVIIAISAYALLAVLTPLMGAIFGFFYSLLNKEKV